MWTAIILSVLTLGVIGVVMFRAWQRSKISWLPLETPIGKIFYVAPKGFNPEHIAEALARVVNILPLHVQWAPGDIFGAAQGLRVLVASTNEWVDGYGRHIAGAQAGSTLFVGWNLRALLHEFAHHCEWTFERIVDEDHSGWEAKGIFKAEAEYVLWLEAPKS